MTPDELLKSTAHRLWPTPAKPWVMTQTWKHLLFAHWPLPVEALRPLVPVQLPLDTFNGQSWVGVTPFRVSNLRMRRLPLPFGSNFLELNVRTYVTLEGKPGVFFFSLDAASLAAVWGARIFYRLPYHHAAMQANVSGEDIVYQSRRLRSTYANSAEFAASYRPLSDLQTSARGSLEYFLTERYCLYSISSRGRLYRAEIHHLPWPLQPASAEISRDTIAQAAGIRLPDVAPLLHFAKKLVVLVWAPQRLA